MKRTATCSIVVLGALVGACAASERKKAEAPASSPADADGAAAPGAYAAPPPPPAQAAPAAVVPTPESAPSKAGTSPTEAKPASRAVALGQAANEVTTAQRELDVAGGDCNNACRALGSMDRAAGRLCGLAQSDDEMRRCGEAKTRVYSARDKVRNTCGTCPDVSVDRSAPIPSR